MAFDMPRSIKGVPLIAELVANASGWTWDLWAFRYSQLSNRRKRKKKMRKGREQPLFSNCNLTGCLSGWGCGAGPGPSPASERQAA